MYIIAISCIIILALYETYKAIKTAPIREEGEYPEINLTTKKESDGH